MNKYNELYDELSHYWSKETLERMLGEYKELVDLATPKKTIPRYFITMPSKLESYGGADCPTCGFFLEGNENNNFCPNCGQALEEVTNDSK